MNKEHIYRQTDKYKSMTKTSVINGAMPLSVKAHTRKTFRRMATGIKILKPFIQCPHHEFIILNTVLLSVI
jgi:hypothetical protein